MTPSIRFTFHDHYDLCDIIIEESGKRAEYGNLRTRKTNLRDYDDPQFVYQVKIPCAKVFGQDYMLCCGMDAIKGFKHPEWQELVFHALDDDDEIIDIPQRKKGKQREAWRQMQLFSAGEGGGE